MRPASVSVQEVVKKVEDWSSKWKLKLNAAKSEVSFFSRLARESKFEPCVKISNPLTTQDTQLPSMAYRTILLCCAAI